MHMEKPCNKMDIFFTKEWAELFAEIFGGQVENFRFGDENKFISYSFIKRPVKQLPFARDFEHDCYDITAPYGYGGVYLSPEAKNDPSFIAEYQKNFKDYCLRNNIISEFIRFHPLDANHSFFADYYDLSQISDNIYIDLAQSEEDLWKNIDKRQRYSIRQAEKSGVIIETDKDFKYLDDFKKLYRQTILRNNAAKFLLFSDDFFDSLLKSFKERIILLIAKLQDKVISAALFIVNDDNAYYFLSGADKDFFRHSPNHLLLHKAIGLIKGKNKRYFNLGGGMKKGDGVFLFKSGFSKSLAPYFVGKKIHNQELYEKLNKLANVENDVDFFPKYRYGS